MKHNNIENHITTHTSNEVMDSDAVTTLECFLSSGGRINTAFSKNDKWPNHDGTFEFVSNPDISKSPEQVFYVQIKGTNNYKEDNGIIKYSLKSLAFPAFIHENITADPGILFIVLNPSERGKQRVFWKYMSPKFLSEIDFNKKSKTIKLSLEDEIENSDAGIDEFCEKLSRIVETHLFLNKLDANSIKKEEAIKILEFRSSEISKFIENIKINNLLRDIESRKILRNLYDLCYATLILNAYIQGYKTVNERLAWELAQFRAETKYLYNFLKGLKYIGMRIPDEGQSERLMLKYYNYLWEIRKFAKIYLNLDIINNLEDFPLDMDKLDKEYYERVAMLIDSASKNKKNVTNLRYYIQKKVPFFVNGERYYEITLQLAGVYATKYNRITVYSKQNIATDYSVRIAYSEKNIKLWGINTKVKIINDWKASIMPSCLNKMGKVIKKPTSISEKYGEYISLMDFLTTTGMNLLDFINLDNKSFEKTYKTIYGDTNTHYFGDTLIYLRKNYSFKSKKIGKHVIRYALLNMREEVFRGLLTDYSRSMSDDLEISNKCFPFEINPFISNIAGGNSSKKSRKAIFEIVNDKDKACTVLPYLKIEEMINKTGELYFDKGLIASDEDIKKYNDSLDSWEQKNGYMINIKDEGVCIDSYEKNTISILNTLLHMINHKNEDQIIENCNYLKNCNFDDIDKKIALQYAFSNSNVMLIYGAAGTGKTTFLKYLSDMKSNQSQLFLSKTHTSVNNLKRRIDNPKADFLSIDYVVNRKTKLNYDIVAIDECSTIDNRKMNELLGLVKDGTKLVLSGDIYQIESIEFGNWFYYAKDIIKGKGINVELLHNWRTEKEELISLWDEVREKKPIIIEKLSIDGPFSSELGEKIFEPEDDDEVVLCLNYDGKFGLNNMNKYFQNADNDNKIVTWQEWEFKVGDKILFIDTGRFHLLYNNLKGTIIEIDKKKNRIIFVIDIKTDLTKQQCENDGIGYICKNEDGTRISIEVISWNEDLSEEDSKKTVIPFHLAYAVSIHKAQGLEYNSVKIIIPSSNAEKISHSIFYTAITRAKEKLKIF